MKWYSLEITIPKIGVSSLIDVIVQWDVEYIVVLIGAVHWLLIVYTLRHYGSQEFSCPAALNFLIICCIWQLGTVDWFNIFVSKSIVSFHLFGIGHWAIGNRHNIWAKRVSSMNIIYIYTFKSCNTYYLCSHCCWLSHMTSCYTFV